MSTTVEEATFTKMEDGQVLPEGYAMMSIPDPTGDVRWMWNPGNKDDVKSAKAQFNDAKKRGMMIYSVDPESGEKGEVVHEFPKKAGKLIAVMQLQGG